MPGDFVETDQQIDGFVYGRIVCGDDMGYNGRS